MKTRLFCTLALMALSVLRTFSAGINVPGSANPWLAGMPSGSTSDGDSAPAQSPVEVSNLALSANSALTFTVSGRVGATAARQPAPPDGGDLGGILGLVSHRVGADNGIAALTAPVESLVGVFLGPEPPSLTPAPVGLDFGAAASREHLINRPLLKQVFFIGDGHTSAGAKQFYVVPAGATRLFLGAMDGFTWNNNIGVVSVDITQVLAWPEVIIDFEDQMANQGQPLGTHCSPVGVTFSNAVWFTPALIGTSYPDHWVSGRVGLGAERGCSGIYPWITPGLTNPIAIHFAFPVTRVSIDVFDVGSNGARLRGYDASGQQIGDGQSVAGTGIGSGNGPHTLTLSADGIRSLVLDQHLFSTVNDGVSFDNLRFTPGGPRLWIQQQEALARIQLEGIVGLDYGIEWTSDLSSNGWHTLTNFFLLSLPFRVIGSSPTNSGSRFYRGVQLP